MKSTSESILQKARKGQALGRQDALEMLGLPVGGEDYYALLGVANAYSRSAFDNRGIVFAQIGLDSQPCHINCKFCSLSQDVLCDKATEIKSLEDTIAQAQLLAASGIEDLFLMTTAEFGDEAFLTYIKAIRKVIPTDMRLVANTSDFDLAYAKALKEVGVTGVYHIHRLHEGIDTGAAPEARIRTMDAVRDAGLTLYYCVEPIGPEHTNEELVEEMLRIRDYPVEVMAVMKRICVPGTPLEQIGEISAARLAQICAVTTLTARPCRAMCVHEPDELCLMAGANQLYAECGVNPRDVETETTNSLGRGFSVADAKKMLCNAQWEI